jgi:hypothetical protein
MLGSITGKEDRISRAWQQSAAGSRLNRIIRGNARLRPHQAPQALPVWPGALLLQLAGEVRNEHVLIIGSGALEIMCALLRKGAAAATLLREGRSPKRAMADLAIMTEIGNLDRMAAAIDLSRDALGVTGRIILRIAADPAQRLASAAAGMLRKRAFSAVRIRTIGAWDFVTGEIPSFGPFMSTG